MHNRRLGQFVLIVLGSLGLVCIAGGHARADAVTTSEQTSTSTSVVNVSTSNNTTSSANVITKQSISNNPSDSQSGTNQTEASDTQKASMQTQSQTDDQKSKSESTVASSDLNTPGATTAPINQSAAPIGESDSAITMITASGEAQVYHSLAGSKAAASRITTSRPSTSQTAHQPQDHPQPTPPASQGAFIFADPGIVSSGSSRNGLHFDIPPAILGFTKSTNYTVALIVVGLLLIGSLFIELLLRAGFSRAPRGSTTPQLIFAFLVSEFDKSLRLESGSLFGLSERSQRPLEWGWGENLTLKVERR